MKKFSINIWQLILAYTIFIAILFFINPASSSLESVFLLATVVLADVLLLYFREKLVFLKKSANGTIIILSLLLVAAVFAPLIAFYEPGKIINAGECKLLPPFSRKMVLYIKNDNLTGNGFEKVIADSFSVKEKVVLYKKSKTIEFEKDNVLFEGAVPAVSSSFFILGTDELGRDLFSRVIHGARLSITIGLSATVLSALISCLFAYVAISRYRFLDIIANRISEIFLAIPSLFIIIFAISFFGNNLFSVILVLAVTSWMTLFKILNGEVKRILNKNFIISSNMLGIAKNKIFFREIIPLILPSIIVNLIFQVANFIIIEASLSFLGLGPGGDYVSWGSIIESGITYLSDAWWLILFPGVFLFFTIVTLNKTGSKLEKYFNPLVR